MPIEKDWSNKEIQKNSQKQLGRYLAQSNTNFMSHMLVGALLTTPEPKAPIVRIIFMEYLQSQKSMVGATSEGMNAPASGHIKDINTN